VAAVPVSSAAAQTVNLPPQPTPITSAVVLPQNLITNGGFETNGGLPWFISANNATIDKVPHRGSLSLRLGGCGDGSALYQAPSPRRSLRLISTLVPGRIRRSDFARSVTWYDGD